MDNVDFLPNPPKEIYLDIDQLDYSARSNNFAPVCVFNEKICPLI